MLKIGDVSVDVLFTPCHTKGHVLYHAKSDDTATGALFSGDTLFIGYSFLSVAEREFATFEIGERSREGGVRVYGKSCE